MEHDVPLYPNPKVSAINSKISNYINSFSHRWNRRGNKHRSFRVTENRKRKKTKVSNFSQFRSIVRIENPASTDFYIGLGLHLVTMPTYWCSGT